MGFDDAGRGDTASLWDAWQGLRILYILKGSVLWVWEANLGGHGIVGRAVTQGRGPFGQGPYFPYLE